MKPRLSLPRGSIGVSYPGAVRGYLAPNCLTNTQIFSFSVHYEQWPFTAAKMHGQSCGWRSVLGNEKTKEDDSILLFRSTPWCAALLDDPALTVFTSKTHRVSASHNNRDSFMKQTLATPGTIRSHVTLRPTSLMSNTYPRVSEVLTIFALGPLLMGHADVAHGGLVATLLDEVMGEVINVNEEMEAEMNLAYKRKQIMTLKLDLTYKKPVPAPGIVLGRASLVKIEGRKRYVKATLEDGQGLILTKADALFLEIKKRLGKPSDAKL